MAPLPSSGRGGPDIRDDIQTLPLDVLYDVLLRLPAKDLCRFRAVCKPWRALLSDSSFITTHSARHPEPLIISGYHPSDPRGILCDLVDLSGRLVKRIYSTGAGIVKDIAYNTQLDLIHVYSYLTDRRGGGRQWLLEPATGAEFALPGEFSEENEDFMLGREHNIHVIALGKVASTGKYKALRVSNNTLFNRDSEQLCEVLTLDGGRDAQWRAKRGCRDPVELCCATINHIVYFLHQDYFLDGRVKQKFLTSFDLETEVWGRTFQGPPLTFLTNNLGLPNNHLSCNHLSLETLYKCLVMVHWNQFFSTDLWFLGDFEKGLWSKLIKIQIDPSRQPEYKFYMRPLFLLKDGRLLVYYGKIIIYDLRTRTCTKLEDTSPFARDIGLYTGSLLRLPNVARDSDLGTLTLDSLKIT